MAGKNRSFLIGLYHAVDGVKDGFRNERSMRIHVLMVAAVVLCGLLLGLCLWEWVVCVVLIGLVLAAELLNTSLEEAMDIVSPEYSPGAKRVKDTAAGAVLIVSLAAAAAGLLIFLPKLWNLFF